MAADWPGTYRPEEQHGGEVPGFSYVSDTELEKSATQKHEQVQEKKKKKKKLEQSLLSLAKGPGKGQPSQDRKLLDKRALESSQKSHKKLQPHRHEQRQS